MGEGGIKMKLKRLTAILLTCAVLFACIFFVSGCKITSANQQARGEFFTLSEAYENGEITRQDLLSIAYYANGGMIIGENIEQYPADFVPTPKEPAVLDKKTENMIKTAYIKKIEVENSTPEEDKIINDYDYELSVDYYGKYGEYYAIRIAIDDDGEYPDHVVWVTVDGVGYWYNPYGGYIYMFKNKS